MSSSAAFVSYAFDRLLPLCRDRFADTAHGGFHERLDPAESPLPLGYKRSMVQARQLYVLAHGALLGDRSGQSAAERGYDFLVRHFWDDRNGGWFFKAQPDGQPLDASKDFYGHAFVLFGLAYAHAAFAAPGALTLAQETWALMRDRLAMPALADGGWGGLAEGASADWVPNGATRRQNPHMHLLEALLALHEVTGDSAWLSEATAVIRLFQARFFDATTHTLGEFFTQDWRPDPITGHIVEPGHHFEWAWLLDRYVDQGGDASVLPLADALFDKAVAHGFLPDGGIMDQMDPQGAPVLRTRRIWPVAEAIKAALSQARRHHGTSAGDAAEALAQRLMTHLQAAFLDLASGRWIETQDETGAPTMRDLPGSTPYHLFLAAAETASGTKGA
ncbi:AGE family epimerase/isomerase [Nitrospirillum sp. BR 11164]|uniref:AGE family epimerase/isomerase n=1 Tax=Nitrospirillum sp. BR 11164 TaxID=3104324 RepID=UPI002AFEC75E|nr:AGE family epimerase/isomerase [Nitrospirillum sp. BR 11164]MEA1647640.1 AGE family epimerase/isomerase [Nitrospirillum sp. BR 11164]